MLLIKNLRLTHLVLLLRRHLTFGVIFRFILIISLAGVLVDHQADAVASWGVSSCSEDWCGLSAKGCRWLMLDRVLRSRGALMKDWLLLLLDAMKWLMVGRDRLAISGVLVMEEISDLVIWRIIRKFRLLIVVIIFILRWWRGTLGDKLLLWNSWNILLHWLQISSRPKTRIVIDWLLKSVCVRIRLRKLVQVFLSPTAIDLLIIAHLIISNERSRCLLMLKRHPASLSLLNNLRLMSRIRGMSTDSSVARKVALIVVIVLLVFGEWIRGSILMSYSKSDGSTSMINVVACVTSVYTSWIIHSMSTTTHNWCKATADCFIMLTCNRVILRWRGWFVVLMMSGRLSTIFVAVTYDFFSLIVKSWVLRSWIVVKSIRPE